MRRCTGGLRPPERVAQDSLCNLAAFLACDQQKPQLRKAEVALRREIHAAQEVSTARGQAKGVGCMYMRSQAVSANITREA
jgi:hypothetical protein